MKVIESLLKPEPAISFEFFPPKTEEGEKKLFDVIAELKKLNPDFVSVTCGAMGANRAKTLFWVKAIKQKYQIEPIEHLTCVADSKHMMKKHLHVLEDMGIENVLALRGDPPVSDEKFVLPANGFSYAFELVAFVKKHKPHFCVGVAGYPEGHPECRNMEKDLKYLKQKVEAGADFIITQLFFDNNLFFEFKKKCLDLGISVPIIPGIMPITSYSQIKKMTDTCGASIPSKLLAKLEKHQEDVEAIKKIGIEQAVSQCKELLADDVHGIHFFVMNQSGPIKEILLELMLVRPQ